MLEWSRDLNFYPLNILKKCVTKWQINKDCHRKGKKGYFRKTFDVLASEVVMQAGTTYFNLLSIQLIKKN